VFRPRRLFAEPVQVRRTNPSKSVRTVARRFNQKLTRGGSALSSKSIQKAKMRIAGADQGNRISNSLACDLVIDSAPLRLFGLRGWVDGRVLGLFRGA
jgi:predicted site-specific integrase-resolvase